MTDFLPLRGRLLDLRRRTLDLLAERSADEITDAGLLALVGNIQATLVAIDEVEGHET